MSQSDRDTIICPCCGEILPDVILLDRMGFNASDWEMRVKDLRQRFLNTYPEYTPEQALREASVIVSLHMYQDFLSRPDEEDEIETPGRPNEKQIYFVQGLSGGPVKIGISINPEERRRHLRYPEELVILATIKGTEQMERELHARFDSIRLFGEWFEPAPELLQYIETCRNKGGRPHA